MSVDDTLRSLGFGLIASSLALVRPATVMSQSLEATPVACKGQIISRIEVHTRPPFEIGGSKVQQRLAREVTRLHATTSPDIIRDFLALNPGQPCTELRRSESERILRAQPYLADATVLAFPDDGGTVSISVLTVDEISLIVGAGGSSRSPYVRGFRLGENNLMGEAMSLDGEWRYNADFHDAVTFRFNDYQLFGRPFHLHLEVARRERGQDWGFETNHPFFTDLQKFSWRTTAGSTNGYRRFRRLDGSSLLLPFSRSYGDVGGVVRLGRPGRVALVGASMSFEREEPGTTPLEMSPGRGLAPVPGTPLESRYDSHRSVRLNALFGVRSISFLSVTGFESLDGLQDLRKGVEVGTLVGRGMRALGSIEPDAFVSVDAYTGFGSPRLFTAMELLGEGRKPKLDEWDGLLVSGRGAVYARAAQRHMIVGDVEWSAGWRQRIPFQLALADRDGGPLGYRRSTLAGARRLVTRLEDRIYIGHLKQFATLGIAPFVNTGALWEGGTPFGTTTGALFSSGVSILASVPPKSQRLWRLDIAVPFTRNYGAGWAVRLSSRDFTRMFWREPGDVSRNRERSVPTSIFRWP